MSNGTVTHMYLNKTFSSLHVANYVVFNALYCTMYATLYNWYNSSCHMHFNDIIAIYYANILQPFYKT